MFSSELRWSGLRYAAEGSRNAQAFALGAPEVLAPHVGDEQLSDGIQRLVTQWADEGLRVMLFAAVPDDTPLRASDQRPQIPDGLRPLALFALREQLRPDAKETLERLSAAGVTLKLISGDNPTTRP